MRRLVPESGATVAGHVLPGGTVVSVPPWASYRSHRNFHNPDESAPERWLSGADKDLEYINDKTTTFDPFSLGPHNCPGQNLAWLELRLIMAKLLWNFELSTPPWR